MVESNAPLHPGTVLPNGLTLATDERLSALEEECSEVIKEICKARRFGIHNRYPEDGPTNAERIAEEAGNILAALDLLVGTVDGISWDAIERARRAHKSKLRDHLKYPTNIG